MVVPVECTYDTYLFNYCSTTELQGLKSKVILPLVNHKCFQPLLSPARTHILFFLNFPCGLKFMIVLKLYLNIALGNNSVTALKF